MNSADLTALADRLEAHNLWRRGDDDPYTIDPAQIGRDLEAAIRIIRLSVLRDDPRHLMRGECPGGFNGPDSRDPDCPACRAMMAIEAAR